MHSTKTIARSSICIVIAVLARYGHSQNEDLPVEYPHDNVSAGYQVDADWPRGKSAYAWKAMPGIAIDSMGLIWTLNRGEMPVQVYSADGKLIKQWGKGYFASPHQIRFGIDGHVWIADTHNHAIYKFTRDGDKLLTLGVPGEPGVGTQRLKRPTDMVESPTGEIFVSDGYRNNRVIVFDAKGAFVRQWGELGAAPGQFSLPHSIARDSKGRIYVADRNNSRVQVFSEKGEFVAEWANLCQPWTVRVTARDEVYICGASPSQWRTEDAQLGIPPKDQIVMKFDTTGRVLQWWNFPQGPNEPDMGAKPGELSWAHGLDIDGQGNVYVGDIMGQRAQKFMLTK